MNNSSKRSDSFLPKIVIDLKQSADTGKDRGIDHSSVDSRQHIVVCAGYGEKNFPFPDTETLVANALTRLSKIDKESPTDENGEFASEELEVAEQKISESSELDFDSHNFGLSCRLPGYQMLHGDMKEKLPVEKPRAIIASLPNQVIKVDATLYSASGGLAELLNDGKFYALVAERFDDQTGEVSWARDNMPAKYQPAIESLNNQLVKLREVYLASLPRTLDGLRAHNPGVPEYELLEAAVEALDEELTPIIDILRIWTDSFGQRRSGKYKELDAIVFSVEQAHYLFDGSDPTSSLTAANRSLLKTRVFRTGCVYVARFSKLGPATLPAGPIGAHAFEVPHDERNLIALMLILYMHEFRHDIFHDVEGLGEELVSLLSAKIAKAAKAGDFKLSQKSFKFGNQQLPLLDLIIKFFIDAIGEVDADISGGVLLCGPAYLYNMISTFGAFNSQGKGVFNTERLLRADSHYQLESNEAGEASLSFFPHPPDYIRAYIVASALDEIGFTIEADECRRLADQGVGTIPDFIEWQPAQDKRLPIIKIAVEDLKAVAPVVAKALIRTPLKSLGGVCAADVMNWTIEREEKAQFLAQLIAADKSDLPQDKGSIHATYVISAATIAYWGLCKSGYQPRSASAIVQKNALKMLDQVRAQFESSNTK